jgi:predicted GTPase
MTAKMPRRVIIMGAGGRDFHNFNIFFRNNPEYKVVAFTAAQIPFISKRTYPPSLAGPLYPEGIPIFAEERLQELIHSLLPDVVVFSYSDVSGQYVMGKASLVMAMGTDFMLLGPHGTMLKSSLPVISVCAVRTGSGKSPLTLKLAGILKRLGKKPAVIRHPMAYSDFERQRAQRFSAIEDLDLQKCTVEEREEYEPLVGQGVVVFAGVDYEEILRAAEKESDVLIWDGGNNDFPFILPDLEIVVADALRPDQALGYFPGEINLRRADIVVINKAGAKERAGVKRVREAVKLVNPGAVIITAESPITVEGGAESLKGRKVLIVEDGPTVTHGGMTYGAGYIAAKEAGAVIVRPRKSAKGSLRDVFLKYPHLKYVLPSMGYSLQQLSDLEATINAAPCDIVVSATPADLSRLIKTEKPIIRVRYSIKEKGKPTFNSVMKKFLQGVRPSPMPPA